MKFRWMIAAALLLAVLITGAGCVKSAGSAGPTGSALPGADRSASASASSLTGEGQQGVVDTFQSLLKIPGNEKAALAQLRQKLPGLSPENASKMVLAFEAYQTDAVTQNSVFTDALVKLIQTEAKEPYNEKTLNDLSAVTGDELKSALQTVFAKGYKLIIPEGMYQAVINYDVYKDFEKAVTPDLAAYIEIMARESESRMLEDAGILIPIDEVFAREELCSGFIASYPASIKIESVKRMYNSYIDSYFYGQNNTPAFDYSSKKLGQDFLDSYKKAAASTSATPAVKAAGDYLKVLDKNQYKLTNAVKKYRDSMITSLKYSLS